MSRNRYDAKGNPIRPKPIIGTGRHEKHCAICDRRFRTDTAFEVLCPVCAPTPAVKEPVSPITDSQSDWDNRVDRSKQMTQVAGKGRAS